MSLSETSGLRDVGERLALGLKSVAMLLRDKRTHRRIALPLTVKMLFPDGTESEAIVRDISAGGAALLSEDRPAVNSNLVIYVEDVGRLEGSVVRHHTHGFAVSFSASKQKKDRVADKLTWVANKSRLGLADDGLSLAGVAANAAELLLSDGSVLDCRIIGLSLNGASIRVTPKPPIGQDVSLGRMRGQVTHHLPDGVGIEFTGAAEAKMA